MIRIAEQWEVTEFYRKSLLNKYVGPYMSIGQYQSTDAYPSSNWEHTNLITECKSALSVITIDRSKENEISIALFNLDPDKKQYTTGKLLLFTMEYIKRFNSRRIKTTVHSTNERSIKLNKHIFGEPVAIIPKDYWDNGINEWVDSLHFIKDLK